MNNFDVLIIGSGPAGLAAAQRFKSSGKSVVLVDAGRAINSRDRDSEAELTRGHGGAGLYSDGKFSFFPSASHLWKLPKVKALRDAYTWTCDVLSHAGLDTPPFPTSPDDYAVGSGEWVLKDYPSDYLTLTERVQLVESLIDIPEVELLTETTVKGYFYEPAEDRFIVELQRERQNRASLVAKRLIIATGRFGPLHMGENGRDVFRRLEVGFRIQQLATKSFFRSMKQLDPKLRLIASDARTEWRTFCACREGATVYTNTLNLWTVSGHSDGPETGLSNVGFNTRLLDQNDADELLPHVLESLSSPQSYFEHDLHTLLVPSSPQRLQFEGVFGKALSSRMLEGLGLLTEKFPEIDDVDTKLIGPTLEGIGRYPALDGSLKLNGIPAWVAGDACGAFRGIVAAFISGYYAASSVLEAFDGEDKWLESNSQQLALA